MKWIPATMLVASSCAAMAQAQTPAMLAGEADILTLETVLAAADDSAPTRHAAVAGVDAARAARVVAGLRPNPELSVTAENLAGSGGYRGLDGVEMTVGVALPLELGGKRQARVAVADAALSRAQLATAVTRADLRLMMTQLYIEAVAQEQRLVIAADQARIAADGAHAADVRVRAGRASPIEAERARVVQLNADAAVAQAQRHVVVARGNLARRMGRPVTAALDAGWLQHVPVTAFGPAAADTGGSLAMASAGLMRASAEADLQLARSQRVPDLTVGPALRYFNASGDSALVFSVSLPLPLFASGHAEIARAQAERQRAEALHQAAALDLAQALEEADVAVENALTAARNASGPALAAAQESARIARIGYREGKFGQLDLLDAERTLAETRLAAVDALVAWRLAEAQRARLITPASQQEF